MIRPLILSAAALALVCGPAAAQSRNPARNSTDIAPGTRAETTAPAHAGEVARGQGALLRGLDKVSGQSTDLMLGIGQSVNFGRLEVRLGECRYPASDPEADAFAQLTITDTQSRKALFTGWMIASSPALSALDDARYDVWVVACNDGSGIQRPDVTYVPDTAVPEGGEGAGPDGEMPPPDADPEPGTGDGAGDTGDNPAAGGN